jgi:hypothetical protein
MIDKDLPNPWNTKPMYLVLVPLPMYKTGVTWLCRHWTLSALLLLSSNNHETSHILRSGCLGDMHDC